MEQNQIPKPKEWLMDELAIFNESTFNNQEITLKKAAKLIDEYFVKFSNEALNQEIDFISNIAIENEPPRKFSVNFIKKWHTRGYNDCVAYIRGAIDSHKSMRKILMNKIK